jgi:hypothetical protein
MAEKVYFEKQSLMLCALHTLNNLFQGKNDEIVIKFLISI